MGKSRAHLRRAYFEALVCELSRLIPAQFFFLLTHFPAKKNVAEANVVHNKGQEMGGIDVQISEYRPSALGFHRFRPQPRIFLQVVPRCGG